MRSRVLLPSAPVHFTRGRIACPFGRWLAVVSAGTQSINRAVAFLRHVSTRRSTQISCIHCSMLCHSSRKDLFIWLADGGPKSRKAERRVQLTRPGTETGANDCQYRDL